MNGILQGTTPTLVITIPEDISVASITAAELSIRHNGETVLYHLSDLIADTEENTFSKTFSEEETLAMNPVSPLIWQLRVKTADGIFGTPQSRISVLDLLSEETIE